MKKYWFSQWEKFKIDQSYFWVFYTEMSECVKIKESADHQTLPRFARQLIESNASTLREPAY